LLNDRGLKKKADILELDTQTTLLPQSKLMNTQMESLIKHLTNFSTSQHQSQAQVKQAQEHECDFCRQGHPNGGCKMEGY
jgi:hypothetical protein